MARLNIQSPDIGTGIVTSQKLANTGVVAGTYSLPTLTVNAKGQLTSINSGAFSPGMLSPTGSGSGLDADLLDGYHASAFALAGHSHALNDLTDVVTPSPKNGQLLEFDGTNWVNAVRPSNEPIGHEDFTESTISFDESTRIFSIAPVGVSHTVWCVGIRYIKTTTETVTIPDTTALYYIYYSSSGVLSYKTSFFTWDQEAPVAYIYWNADDNRAYYLADERHGVTLDWATHEYLHRTRGAAYASGFGVNNYTTTGNGSLDSHAQIDLADGTFFDEDLQIDIVHAASPVVNTWQQHLQGHGRFPIFYRTGNVWKRTSPTNFPIYYTTAANYNLNSAGHWSPVTLANNRYGISWLVATNNLTYPAMVILGQAEYTNEAGYAAANWSDLDLSGFPSVEFRPLHKIVYQTSTSYANTPKSRFVHVYDLRSILPTGGVTSLPVTDHGALTGLGDDDHLQYLTSPRANTWLGTKSIGALSDVSPSTPLDGQALIYHSASGQWRNSTLPSGVTDHGLLTGLSDDDHLQYLTSPRADTWLSTKTTTNLLEGTNLYYTDERAQDAFGGMVSPSSTIKWSYNDVAGKITASVSPAGISHSSLADLTTGDPHTQYQIESEKNSANGYMGLDSGGRASPTRLGSGTPTSSVWLRGDGVWSTVPYSPADAITVDATAVKNPNFESTPGTAPLNAVLVTWGIDNGVSPVDVYGYVTYSGLNTWLGTRTTTNLTEGTNLYYTDERAQDAFGAMVSPSSTIRWTYNDAAGKIQAFVSPANISHADLANLTSGDPHTQYQLKSQKNVANGYAGLDASGLVSPVRIPAMPLSFLSDVSPGTPTNGQVLTYHTTSGQWRSTSPTVYVTDHGALTGLADDDHTQYLTSPRANTWLATKTTTNLLEGSNLYYTDERVQDAVGAMVSPSSTVRWTYNDAAGKIQAFVSPANIDHGALGGLTDDDHLQYLTSPRANTWLATKTTTNLTEGSNLYYTDERAQDAFGGMVSPSSTIKWSYNDVAGKITASVSPAGISHASLADLTSGDPHTQYQLKSEKNTANGYAGLNSSGLLSPSRIPAMPLSFLSDVSPSSVTNGQVLTYHSASGQWRNSSPSVVITDHGLLTGLADDDHTQYLTSPRANTWLATKTTDNLTQGSTNLYFTDERAQDAVGNILTNTSTIKWTYNDGSNIISADVSPAGISHASLANLTTGDPHTQYQLESEKNVANGYAGLNSSGLLSPSRIPAMPLSFLSDVSPSSVTNGQVLTYHAASTQWRNTSPSTVITDHGLLTGLVDDDHLQYLTSPRANTWLATKTTTNLTEGSNLYYTDERAQDAVGGMVSPSSTIKWTYNDVAGKIIAQVSPAGISHASLANLTTGDPHTQYQLKSEKNAVNGYAGLNSSGLLSPSRIPAMPLSFLSDVSPSSSTNGQVLTYHSASGQWRNQSPTVYVTDHGNLTGLADDDHLQYLTSPRANTWLATKTTTNLTEGTNLYYSDERVQDAVGAMVSPSSTIRWTYNDTAGKIQAFVSPANISHAALSNLTTGDPHTQYQLESEKNTANGYMGLDSSGRASPARLGSGTPTSSVWLRGDGVWSSVPYSPADAITVDATAVKNPNFESTPGTTPLNSILVTWGLDNSTSPVDVYGYITYSGLNTWLSTKTTTNLTEGTNLYYTDERVQDAVGAMVSPSTTIRWTYNDTAGKIQAFVSPANISHASLANLTTGDPHTQYQLKSEKNSANGYAGLNASGLLSPSRIPAMPLSFLSDVSPTAPTNGQVLTYHSASSQWRNQSPTGGGVTDHSALTGLGNDDHTQYALLDGTRPFDNSGLKIWDSITTYSLTFTNNSAQSTDHFIYLDTTSPVINVTLRGDLTVSALGAQVSGNNNGDVTLAGSYDYITLANQVITRGQIDLTTDVTGDLPFSNITPATSPSVLLGRGSASSGDFQQITLGSGLTMTGTTLSSSGGSGTSFATVMAINSFGGF